jgi:hypothetical protein
MTSDTTLVVQPLGCKTPIKIRTFELEPVFGEIQWTDHQLQPVMLQQGAWLRKHPVENVLFWSDECEEMMPGGLSIEDVNATTKIPHAVMPSAEDYIFAVHSHLGSTDEKLRYLRLRIWWEGNNPIRRGECDTLTAPFLDNLARLLPFFEGASPQRQLIKAEALRELALFKDALKVLDHEVFGELEDFASFLASLCRAEDPRVARWPSRRKMAG